MTPLIEITNLRYSIATGHIIQGSKTILDNVTFNIQQGTSTAYLGINGAGKTSTFRILCGLVKQNSGLIKYNGKIISSGIPPQRLGFMPEQPYFYKNLTPYALLEGLGHLSGLSGSNLHKSIMHWAEKLNFSAVLKQPLSGCSKGQVQRVGLAQALLHQPDFILLDEPLSGLDPLGRACVRQVIHDELKRGATLLCSSHILSDTEAMCQQTIILHKGKVAFSGEIKSLLQSNQQWVVSTRWKHPSLQNIEPKHLTQMIDGTWRILCKSIAIRDQVIQQILAAEEATLMSVQAEQQTLEEAFIHILNNQQGIKA